MIPSPEDTVLNIPITLDYKGGRSENGKNKWILLVVCFAIGLIAGIGILTGGMPMWKKVPIVLAIWYIILVFLRFFAFKEIKYSDIYETLKETKNELPINNVWNIFDIDYHYPYICYFRNGAKGIFVKMEKDAITGKGETARYDHYEAVSEAYNIAHNLNMDIVHIDYMDNVGNDTRLQDLYSQLKDVENPDMEAFLIALYDNLAHEMSRNYSSFDIYLYLTRDKIDSFIYNVQMVSNAMLSGGGNFITYKVLDRDDIRMVCMALFNLHEFSVTDACAEVLQKQRSQSIVPIKLIEFVTDENGKRTRQETILNKTQAQLEYEEELKRQEEELELAKKKQKHRFSKKRSEPEPVETEPEEDVDLFS